MARSRLGALFLALALAVVPLCTRAEPGAVAGSAPHDARTHGTQRGIPLSARARVAPELLEQLLAGDDAAPEGGTEPGMVSYIVYLRDEGRTADLEREPRLAPRRQVLVQRLQDRAGASQRGLTARLEELRRLGNVQRYRSLWIVNAIAITSDADSVLEIARRPEVASLQPNRLHRLPAPDPALPALASDPLPWGLTAIGADRVWTELGVTGEGVVVANLDSGVDWTHPALQHRYRGYNPAEPDDSVHDYNWFDPTGTYPTEPGPQVYKSWISDHGTHVMGIIVGSLPDGSRTIGVAPGARWIAGKVFDDYGFAYDEWVHAGLQWCLAPTDLGGEHPDPSKAPDIVNASWGSVDLVSAFDKDIAALRAAGIFTVFAAGNNGPEAGTINSPGSLPYAFAVGSTDQFELIATSSARGPSLWGEIKPDLVAPGQGIESCVAGGNYKKWGGTSMAAPHVAGAVALLWSADRAAGCGPSGGPMLTVARTEELLTRSAVDLGPAGADNTYGWGRLDAYAAVSQLMHSGLLEGQASDGATGEPLPGVRVTLREQTSGEQAEALSAEDGSFSLLLREGEYDLTGDLFGYSDPAAHNVRIVARETVAEQAALQPLALGFVQGRVTGSDIGAPATVVAAGTPARSLVDANGDYRLELPPGTYTLRALPDAPGYRGSEAVDVQVIEGATTELDLALQPAPRILLVDADAWLGASTAVYYASALQALRYGYALHSIDARYSDLPSADELLDYDLVIWWHIRTSPGRIGAWGVLADYLEEGGRLLLSGQSIGLWDDKGSNEYRHYLHIRHVGADTALEPQIGASGRVLEGVALAFNTEDSATNQISADLLEPLNWLAQPIIGAEAGQPTGVVVDTFSYRVFYLGFGFEGVGPQASRVAAMDRLIEAALLPLPKPLYLPAVSH